MKRELPMPLIIGVIAVVVVVVAVFGYRAIVQPKPALVPGGVHVTPPNFAHPPSNGMGGGAPATGGQ